MPEIANRFRQSAATSHSIDADNRPQSAQPASFDFHAASEPQVPGRLSSMAQPTQEYHRIASVGQPLIIEDQAHDPESMLPNPQMMDMSDVALPALFASHHRRPQRTTTAELSHLIAMQILEKEEADDAAEDNQLSP